MTPARRRDSESDVHPALRHLDPVQRFFLGLQTVPSRTRLPVLLATALACVERQWLYLIEVREHDDFVTADLAVLLRLQQGRTTASELGRVLQISRQAAGARVRGLMDRGYVTQDVCLGDARSYFVTLTGRGHQVAETAQDAIEELLDLQDGYLHAEAIDSLLVSLTALSRPVAFDSPP